MVLTLKHLNLLKLFADSQIDKERGNKLESKRMKLNKGV